MLIVFISFLISFIFVATILPHILLLSLRKRLFDPIDPRKVHSVPASRLGGVTFFPSILFSVWFCVAMTNVLVPQEWLSPVITISVKMVLETLGLLLLFMIGVYDDVIGVAYRLKFLVQIAAAALIITSGVYFNNLHGLFGIHEIPDVVGILVTAFLYVFVTNAINLIDGIDGLASLLSIMALMVYGAIFVMGGQVYNALVSFATAGALLPFWYTNVFGIKRGSHSKIFMGDTGALVIGSILGFLAVSIWNMTINADGALIDDRFYIIAYTMLLVPCFDVVRIIIHRFRDHKPLFLPDKNHIHHKFMALGFSPRKSLLWIIFINIAFLALNLALSYMPLNITVVAIIDVVIWTVMHLYISKKMRDYAKRVVA